MGRQSTTRFGKSRGPRNNRARNTARNRLDLSDDDEMRTLGPSTQADEAGPSSFATASLRGDANGNFPEMESMAVDITLQSPLPFRDEPPFEETNPACNADAENLPTRSQSSSEHRSPSPAPSESSSGDNPPIRDDDGSDYHQ